MHGRVNTMANLNFEFVKSYDKILNDSGNVAYIVTSDEGNNYILLSWGIDLEDVGILDEQERIQGEPESEVLAGTACISEWGYPLSNGTQLYVIPSVVGMVDYFEWMEETSYGSIDTLLRHYAKTGEQFSWKHWLTFDDERKKTAEIILKAINNGEIELDDLSDNEYEMVASLES